MVHLKKEIESKLDFSCAILFLIVCFIIPEVWSHKIPRAKIANLSIPINIFLLNGAK